MANAFDFTLAGNDEASAAIARIEEAVRQLQPALEGTRNSLMLGGRDTSQGLDEYTGRLQEMSRAARDNVQFIGDMVPPLKMVTGLVGGFGGVATAVKLVSSNLTEFANSGYRIDTTAKNISMTTQAFQQLTGAMVENGSARDDAEKSLSGLFDNANEAVHGRKDDFLALLSQKGVGIHKTKEGLADVSRLIDDLNSVMQSMSSGDQALFARKLGVSPDLLSYLRQTTGEVQQLKDQAQRDGLIFSDEDIRHALAFRAQLNQITASYDGMLKKSQAYLGQSETVKQSAEQFRQLAQYGLDSTTVGNILTFNNGGKQADMLRKADKDEDFKKTLSWKERLDLSLGYASEGLMKRISAYYPEQPQILQPKPDASAAVPPVTPATVPQAAANTPDYPKRDISVAAPSPPQNVNPPGGVHYGQRDNHALGLRNNNPGNLRAAPNTSGRNGGFVQFPTAHDGLAALARQLQLYADRGNNTLSGILHTYAPSGENNTQAYIRSVSDSTGYQPREKLDMHNPGVLQQVMAAIIHHENGAQPYSASEISQGIHTSINDERWKRGRDPQRLLTQRQEDVPPAADGALAVAAAGPPLPDPRHLSEAFRSALEDQKMQIELTVVNDRTGERQRFVTRGGRVTASMSSP